MFKTEYVLLMSDAPFLPYAVVHSFFSIVGLAQKQFERIDIPYTVSLYIKRKERKKGGWACIMVMFVKLLRICDDWHSRSLSGHLFIFAFEVIRSWHVTISDSTRQLKFKGDNFCGL